MRKASCVVLLSGGLDSTLAAKVLMEQGIHVTGVNFAGAYCPVPLGTKSNAEKAAEHLGIELVRLPIDEGFIEMVKAPRYGRGKNMNPCIDCHILMVKRAWEWGQGRSQKSEVRTQNAEGGRQTEDTRYQIPDTRNQESDVGSGAVSCKPLAVSVPRADFVATGEVLGQRPMSQNKQSLGIVARRSGAEGYLLRPLSAKLLEPTIPEKEGLVDREKLLDMKGRGRQRQMELAERYGITDYPAPAGGCLLTDAGYAARLREALAHKEDSVEMIELLSLGRHFRLPSGSKVIVGRDKAENEELLYRLGTQPQRPPSPSPSPFKGEGIVGRGSRTAFRAGAMAGAVVIDAQHLPGPVGVLIPAGLGHNPDSGDGIGLCPAPDASDKSDRLLAARICARYSDRRKEPRVTVLVGGEPTEVEPASAEEADGCVVR